MAKKNGPEGHNGGPAMEDPEKPFPIKTIALALVVSAAGAQIVVNGEAISEIRDGINAVNSGADDFFEGVIQVFKGAFGV